MKTTISDERLATVLRLVSMDIAAPFYEVMGLQVPNVRIFQSYSRWCLTEINERIEGQENSESLVDMVANKMEAELGVEVRDNFFEWAVSIFVDSPQDHPHSLVWMWVLGRCASSDSGWKALKLPESRSEALRVEYRQMRATPEIPILEEKQKQLKLSEFDARMHEAQGFDGDVIDPYDLFANTAYRKRFLNAIRKLAEELSPAELEQLRTNLSRIAVDNGTWKGGELKLPNDLREPAC